MTRTDQLLACCIIFLNGAVQLAERAPTGVTLGTIAAGCFMFVGFSWGIKALRA